ncbi:MAG TPA: hypothetical protein VGJ29_05605 [Vicinamibacterales bacterium]
MAPRYQTCGIPNAPADWVKLVAARHNVLIEGPRPAIETAVSLLERGLTGPIVRKRPEESLDLDRCELLEGGHYTLILEDVIGLNVDEQTRLRQWLDHSAGMRIISTASSPVFHLVEHGLFDEALYYRLNVMLVRTDAVERPTARGAEASRPLEATRRSDGGQ